MEKHIFIKRLLLSFMLTCVSCSAFAIDILFAFSQSGMEEVELSTGAHGDELGRKLIEQINDTYELSGMGRPFNLAGMYTHPDQVEYLDSVQMYLALIGRRDVLAANIEEKRNIYGADLVVFFWGQRDTSDTRYAGHGAANSNIVSVWGKYATLEAVIEHELGHEFALHHDHDPDSTSIMTVENIAERAGYDFEETVHISSLLANRADLRTRDSDTYLYNEGLFVKHRYSAIKYQTCDTESAATSFWVSGITEQTSIGFTNSSREPVEVYWLDYYGNKVLVDRLGPGESFAEGTATTHLFLVEVNGECIGMVNNSVANYEEIEIRNRTQSRPSDVYHFAEKSSSKLSYAVCSDAVKLQSTWDNEPRSTALPIESDASNLMCVYWLDYPSGRLFEHILFSEQSVSSGMATAPPFQIEVDGECIGVETRAEETRVSF